MLYYKKSLQCFQFECESWFDIKFEHEAGLIVAFRRGEC